MARRDIRPWRAWVRHHPSARRIAAHLLQIPALLGLRTRRLVADVRERYGVSVRVAMTAVAMARRAVREVSA